jgi:hypothetical protein
MRLVFDELKPGDLPIYAYSTSGSLAFGTYVKLSKPKSIKAAQERVLQLVRMFRFGTIVIPWRWTKVKDFNQMIEMAGFRVRYHLDCPTVYPEWAK